MFKHQHQYLPLASSTEVSLRRLLKARDETIQALKKEATESDHLSPRNQSDKLQSQVCFTSFSFHVRIHYHRLSLISSSHWHIIFCSSMNCAGLGKMHHAWRRKIWRCAMSYKLSKEKLKCFIVILGVLGVYKLKRQRAIRLFWRWKQMGWPSLHA